MALQLLHCVNDGASLPQVLGVGTARIVYVESVCRVETLSATARILYYVADRVLVQWPELQQKYPRTTYLGRLS